MMGMYSVFKCVRRCYILVVKCIVLSLHCMPACIFRFQTEYSGILIQDSAYENIVHAKFNTMRYGTIVIALIVSMDFVHPKMSNVKN